MQAALNRNLALSPTLSLIAESQYEFATTRPNETIKIKGAAFIAYPAADFEALLQFYRNLLDLPIVKQGEDGFSPYTHFDAGGFGLRVRCALSHRADGW